MKKLYPSLTKSHGKNHSLSLLILSFTGGWILATWIFYIFGHAVRAALLSLFHSL
jgi:hypothetical protein